MDNTQMLVKNGKGSQARSGWQTTYTPRVDILETEEGLLLHADLPGVKPEDLEVRFEQDELTVHGRVTSRPEHGHDLLREYDTGEFHRVFRINEDVDANRISATLKQGVLTLCLPRSERARPRKIDVKGA